MIPKQRLKTIRKEAQRIEDLAKEQEKRIAELDKGTQNHSRTEALFIASIRTDIAFLHLCAERLNNAINKFQENNK